jgi:hypothetical protein
MDSKWSRPEEPGTPTNAPLGNLRRQRVWSDSTATPIGNQLFIFVRIPAVESRDLQSFAIYTFNSVTGQIFGELIIQIKSVVVVELPLYFWSGVPRIQLGFPFA